MSALTLDGTGSPSPAPLPHPCGPSKDGWGDQGLFPASALPPYGPSKSHACVQITDSKEPLGTGRNSELYFTAGETVSKKLQGLLKAMHLVSKRHLRTSLDVQCLGIHFPIQSHQIRSLVRELRSHMPAVQPEKKKSQTLPPELSSMLGMCAVMP